MRRFISTKRTVASGRHSQLSASLPQVHVKIHVLGDGFLVFEFSKNPQLSGGAVDIKSLQTDLYFSPQAKDRQVIVRERARLMNAFLGCLHEGAQPLFGVEAQPGVNPENYMTGSKTKNGGWDLEGPSLFVGEYDCPEAIVLHTAKLLNLILRRFGSDGVELLSLLQTATFQYRSHNFGAALTLGWFGIEFLLNLSWNDYLNRSSKHTKISAKRREQLDGRDFTASVISQILSLGGKVDDPLLNDLNRARKKRNDFAHELKAVDADDAGHAIRLAASMISARIGRKFQLPLSYSWRP